MKCEYFGKCGGCSLQNLCYKKQIKLKEKILERIFNKKIKVWPSPIAFHYRNKMDFVYAFGKIGLRKRKNFKEVVDIKKCLLISNKLNDIFTEIRDLIKKYNIEGYDYIKHKGYLRYIVLRESKFLKQVMINFITSSYNKKLENLIENIRKRCDSVVWSINNTLSDVSFGKVYKYYNKEEIEEKLYNIIYKISPNVFFQNNSFVIKKILKKIKKEICYENILDLYSGIGCISLFLGEKAKKIVGVDNNKEAIKIAKENAKLNNITNCKFITDDVKTYLNKIINKKENFDIIIADPPRCGIGKPILKIEKLAPKKFIYLSCNPLTMNKDLKLLKYYKIKSLEAFDMFPQTEHIEILGILEK